MRAQWRRKPRTCAAAGDAGCSRDHGFTLVELVIVIAILGIVVAPMLQGFVASIRDSSTVSAVDQVDTVLINAADFVHRAPQACDYSQYASAAALARGWPAGAVTSRAQAFVPATGATVAGWASVGCASGASKNGMQLITITVTSPQSGVTRTMQVVKSDV